ncbi:MAG: T9SS type A sorting domain-containing protein [Dysgonamonadaceae bacterium]|jgi:hypothetical protein|nr:T9SS type A sorting domain-containing protein [Dysgonamonadaceae bacterium]
MIKLNSLKIMLLTIGMMAGSIHAWGQTYYTMSSGNYTETFTNWSAWATNWNGVDVLSTGAIPAATKTTVSTTGAIANVGTSTAIGRDAASSTKLVFLTTGTTDNSTAVACDLNLNFTNRTAGSVSFDVAGITNGIGVSNNRTSTLRLYYSLDNSTWAELTDTDFPFIAINNTECSASVNISLPAILNNQSTVKLRFYCHNGGAGGNSSGSRPKISLDNVVVTSTAASAYTVSFEAGNGTCTGCSAEGLTETSPGAGITLPVATPPAACGHWTFAGWVKSSVSETTEAPALYAAETTYKPSQNETLYAVYSQTTGIPNTYKLVNSTASLEAGKKYLIANGLKGTVKAMEPTTGGSSATNRGVADAAVSSLSISLDGSSTLPFTLEQNSGNYNFKTAANLYLTSVTGTTNTLQTVATPNSFSNFSIDFSGDVALITCTGKTSNNLVRYYTDGTDPRFSCYNISSANKPVYLFKETAFATVYNSNPDCNPCEAALAFDPYLPSSVIVGDLPFNAAATATNADDATINYSSSNTNIATIDATGEITIGSQAGSVTITAALTDGSCEATAEYNFTVHQGSRTYVLVTDKNDLVAGEKYLVAGYKTSNTTYNEEESLAGCYTLGLQTTNNRLGIFVSSETTPSIKINTETASNNQDSKPFELTLAGNENDGWTLFDAVNEKFLGPEKRNLSSNQNVLRGSDNVPTYTISIAATGVATLTCFGEESAAANNGGRDIIKFNSGSGGNNPLFASYASGQSSVYLYRLREMAEFWLEEGKTASFADNQWRVKFEGETGFEPQNVLVSVPENNNRVRRIVVSGHALVPDDEYTTQVLEINTKGIVHVDGSLRATVEAIMHSDDNSTAQMKSGAEGTLSAQTLKVKKAFQNEEWYMVSFPFDVKEIRNADENQVLVINPKNAQTGVWGKTYDGAKRAAGSYSDQTSANWKWIPDNTAALSKNTGYLFGQDFGTASTGPDGYETLTFISDSPASVWTWSTSAHKEHVVTPYHSAVSNLHQGWNLIGNPNTSAYHLRNHLSDYITYVYSRASNDYDEDYGIVEPFKAFFVQVEDATQSIVFNKDGVVFRGENGSELRSASGSSYDQIRLSLTKDNSFYDYFALRVGGDGVTTGYDLNKDAQKMISSTSPQIYSAYKGVDYAINAIPDTETMIPLAYQVYSAGNYTIRLEASSLNVSKLLLIDKQNNSASDLLAVPSYQFTAAGTQNNTGRFELQFELFGANAPTSAASVAAGKITVGSDNRQLILHGLEALSTVSLYDLAGKKIAAFTKVDNNQPLLLNQLTGVYVVKIENNSQAETAKIALK